MAQIQNLLHLNYAKQEYKSIPRMAFNGLRKKFKSVPKVGWYEYVWQLISPLRTDIC